MRIEGTYTFPTTIDRVFAALLRPDVLAETIPGCERLIQLGPTSASGDVTFEARVQSETSGPATLTLKTTASRQPEHMQLEISGYAAGARISGQAVIDLVDMAEQGDHTLGAYVLTLADLGWSSAACQIVIQEFCTRFSDYLYTKSLEHHSTISSGEAESILADPGPQFATVGFAMSQGQVIPLPSRSALSKLDREEASAWRQRALWMGTGMLIGGLILSIATVFLRWLGDHED
jgi:carbon monoxide dehydrogenase subunit G